MSSPRLPRQMEAVRVSGVDDDGNGVGQFHLVDRASQPVFGSGLASTEVENIDASTTGVHELARLRAIVPPTGLRLAGSFEVRTSWEIRSAAADGSFARFRASVELQKRDGSVHPIAGPVGFISRPIDTAGNIFNERVGSTLPPPDELGIVYEPGDRIEVVLETEVTTANGGEFDVRLHHDPTDDPSRLFVEWMTGES